MEKLRVVIKRCGEKPCYKEIDNTLEELQGIVGGYIEVYPVNKNISIICNEEGKLLDLPINFIIQSNRRIEIINGDCLFVGNSDYDFRSLTIEEVEETIELLNYMNF